ncbi:ATP-binding protein [Hymenobacter sp. UV11]|uniref:AAA family ATPase n=1 Tax=Hymenobacter sp. UV11 TaxID=1849735 RepID=UPI00105B40FF|nr:ATP-binding protein [Hymenobacter sp. UV11]TFZ63060.1 ATP-binding protein [Hymenobacter sp. UV11]
MKLILFRGRPGTGKTTLSTALAAQTNYPLLSKDSIHDALANILLDQSQLGQIAYTCLYATLAANSQQECTFILDYPFQTTADIRRLRAWCAAHTTTLYSVVVHCSQERVWAARFNQRALNPLPNQLITDFTGLKQHYGELNITLESGELLVDSLASIPEVLDQVNTFLNQSE